MTTATVKPVEWTGPFTSGEIPLPFTVRFDPADIDFTGYDVGATLEDDDGTEMVFDGTVDWQIIDQGVAVVQLGADDVVIPSGSLMVTRRLQVWAGNAANRVATVEIKFNCHRSVGTPPSI